MSPAASSALLEIHFAVRAKRGGGEGTFLSFFLSLLHFSFVELLFGD